MGVGLGKHSEEEEEEEEKQLTRRKRGARYQRVYERQQNVPRKSSRCWPSSSSTEKSTIATQNTANNTCFCRLGLPRDKMKRYTAVNAPLTAPPIYQWVTEQRGAIESTSWHGTGKMGGSQGFLPPEADFLSVRRTPPIMRN